MLRLGQAIDRSLSKSTSSEKVVGQHVMIAAAINATQPITARHCAR